jgi:hypothetical protein
MLRCSLSPLSYCIKDAKISVLPVHPCFCCHVLPCLQMVVPAAASDAHTSPATFDQTQYKEKSRKLVTLVNQLRDAGAQASFTLPSLVVCGNQSAGKSSLLERLCGVKLPRAAGTCTKCPTEVCSQERLYIDHVSVHVSGDWLQAQAHSAVFP